MDATGSSESLPRSEDVPPAVRSVEVPFIEPGELLVFRSPKRLPMEAVPLLERKMIAALQARMPIILEDGCSLEVVRSGGWVYTYEREPSEAGTYEVAAEILTPEGSREPLVFDASWVPPSGGCSGEWAVHARSDIRDLIIPYAWRPAPVPPPVRRATPIPEEALR